MEKNMEATISYYVIWIQGYLKTKKFVLEIPLKGLEEKERERERESENSKSELYICIYVCVYVCMYVCMYVYVVHIVGSYGV